VLAPPPWVRVISLALMAGAAGLFVLWSRSARGPGTTAGGDSPPVVVAEPPINPDTGEPLGSPADIAHTNEQANLNLEGWENSYLVDILNTVTQAIGTGASIGALALSWLGPVGIVIGGFFGAVAGAIVGWFIDLGKAIEHQNNPPPPPTPPPYELMGLPYRPDLTRRKLDGSVVLGLPQLVDPEQVQVAHTVSVDIPAARLRQLFPGTGALEACRRSGLLTWRPFDIPTPFTAELYQLAPLLFAYEIQYIGQGPGDLDIPGHGPLRWWEMVPSSADDTALAQFVLMARRLAAWREMRLGDAHAVAATAYEAGFTNYIGKPYHPNTVVLRRRDVGNYLAWVYARDHWDEMGANDNERRARWGAVEWVCQTLGVSMLERIPQKAAYEGDAVSWRERGGDWRAHRTPAGLGFPGAWRLAPAGTPETPARADRPRLAPAVTKTASPDYVTWAFNRDALLATRDRLKSQLDSLLAAGGGPGVIELLTAYNQAKLDVLMLGTPPTATTDATLVDTVATRAPITTGSAAVRANPGGAAALAAQALSGRRGPDPQNAFEFQCWLFSGPTVVGSWRFLDAFGSHAAVRQAIEAGHIAWNPASNSAAVTAAWHRFDPALQSIGELFDAWQPFQVETL